MKENRAPVPLDAAAVEPEGVLRARRRAPRTPPPASTLADDLAAPAPRHAGGPRHSDDCHCCASGRLGRDRLSRRQIPEVGQQPPPVLGADRLRVELHAPARQRARCASAIRTPSSSAQAIASNSAGSGSAQAERVVADRRELLRNPGEERLSRSGESCVDPAVHRRRRVDAPRRRRASPAPGARGRRRAPAPSAARIAAAQTPKSRRRAPAAPAPARSRCCRSRCSAISAAAQPRRCATTTRLDAVDLGQQLEEVVGEGVVVVDQQRAHRRARILTR